VIRLKSLLLVTSFGKKGGATSCASISGGYFAFGERKLPQTDLVFFFGKA
jgi:hypothetical protein